MTTAPTRSHTLLLTTSNHYS